MNRIVKIMALSLALVGIFFSNGVASAHSIESDNGYTGVLHIDPDDEPTAGTPAVLNFYIGKNGHSFNQNDYNIKIDIATHGKVLSHLTVEPKVFGNASDGVAQYTFPAAKSYDIDLYGQFKNDPFTKFHMRFEVAVAASTVAMGSVNGGNKLKTFFALSSSLIIGTLLALKFNRKAERFNPKIAA